MRPIDPAVACRRLVEDDEDLDTVTARTHGHAREVLVRGIVALLRPKHDRHGLMSLDDIDPEVVVQVLVARAQVAGRSS